MIRARSVRVGRCRGICGPKSVDQAEGNSDSFVGLGGSSIAAHQHIVRRTRGRGDQRIVRRSAADANFDQPRNESAVMSHLEPNTGIGKSRGQEVPHEVPRDSVRRWQSGQD